MIRTINCSILAMNSSPTGSRTSSKKRGAHDASSAADGTSTSASNSNNADINIGTSTHHHVGKKLKPAKRRNAEETISDDDAEEIIDAIVDPQRILTEEDWEKVMYLAIHRPADFGSSAKPTWYLRRYAENEIGPGDWHGTLFHFVVAQNPPLAVVKQVLEAGTYPPQHLTKSVVDKYVYPEFRFPRHAGAYGMSTYDPIHYQRNTVSMSHCPLVLAILTGASLDVVKYLADATGDVDAIRMGKHLLSVAGSSMPMLSAILGRHPTCVRAREKEFSGPRLNSFLSLAVWPNRRNRKDVDVDKLDLILMATAAGTIDASQAKKKNYLRPHALIFHLLDIRKGCLTLYETKELRYHLDRYARICPEEFKLCDNDGDLPLHILIVNSRGFPRVSNQSQVFRLLLGKIIDLHPDAVNVRNKAGQTPLDLAAALASPFYDIVLAHSSAEVVNAPCPSTSLLPFQSAACGYVSEQNAPKAKKKSILNPKEDEVQVFRTEICFEMLRKAPDAVDPRRLGLDTSWLDNKLVREIHFDELKLKYDMVKLHRKKRRLERLNNVGGGDGPGCS